MPAQQYAASLVVKVQGSPLPKDVLDLLEGAVVDDDADQPDMFTLRFRDPDRLVLAKSGIQIGSPVVLSVAGTGSSAPQELVQGEVTALEAEFDATGTFTTVRGYDKAHRLQRGTRALTYIQSTYSDIARKIATRNGLRAGRIDSSGTVHPFVEQPGSTDWDFLRRLAAEIGFEVGVEAGALVFAKPAAASAAPGRGGTPAAQPLALELGHDLSWLRGSVSAAGLVPEVTVRGWNPATQRAVVGKSPTRTSSAASSVDPASVAKKLGAVPWVVTDAPYREQRPAEAAAGAVADRIAAGLVEYEGEAVGNPKLRSGVAVSLNNLGAPFDGKYVLRSARHVFDPTRGYTTEIRVGARRGPAQSSSATPDPAAPTRRFPGVVVGVVSDLKDPDKQGRVKVALPWLGDEYVTHWARVLQVGAGADRGTVVLPEVNDEVLVAFEQGDLGEPYVLGGLYSAKHKPKPGKGPDVDASKGQVVRRALVTRTGHTLEFLESNSAKAVRLATGDGKLEVGLDAVEVALTVRSDGTVEVLSKKGVTVDGGTGPVKVTGQKIELAAKAGVSIDGGGGNVEIKGVKVDVKGNAAVDVSGAKVAVQGQATADLKAGAMVTVQGALVKIN